MNGTNQLATGGQQTLLGQQDSGQNHFNYVFDKELKVFKEMKVLGEKDFKLVKYVFILYTIKVFFIIY